jgi:SAM-dependent methyltransferase
MAGHHHPHDHRDHGPAAEPDEAAMAELLDLEGEVLHSYLAEVTSWAHDLIGKGPSRRILDIGSGTGTGTFALLERFAHAHAIAVDLSPRLLRHLKDKARSRGMADRAHIVRADLNTAWPFIETVDLAWASMSLHHMADPDRALSEIFAVLRPGGLLFVAELGSFPRFLPDDIGIGQPGLEERVHAAIAERRAAELPDLGADWGPRLSRAGFVIEADRHFAIDLVPPLPASTPRYAQAFLARLRSHADGLLTAADVATLDTIIESDGPDSVLQRNDLTVRAARRVWVARRRFDA